MGQIIIDSLLVLFLLAMAIEDFRSREIHVLLYALSGIVMGVHFVLAGSPWFHVLVNLCFVAFQMGCVMVYSYMRNKSWQPFGGMMGLGDLLLWLLLIFAFSPFNFIIFFVGGLMLALMVHFVVRNPRFSTIPLAGVQGGLFAVVLLSNYVFGEIEFQSDEWLIQLLLPYAG